MLQPVTIDQALLMIDVFARKFSDTVTQAAEIDAWNDANATEANRAAHLLKNADGTDLSATDLATLNTMLNTIGLFATWATTNNAAINNVSPLAYFRSIQRLIR